MKNLKQYVSVFFKTEKYYYLVREALKNLRYSTNRKNIFLSYIHNLKEDSSVFSLTQ